MFYKNVKCFLIAAEQKSLSKTAELLFLSKAAVFKQINSLEDELGVSLFERNHQGVFLTPAGREFYRAARQLVDGFDASILGLQKKYSSCRRVCVGAYGSDAYLLIPGFLRAVREQYPQFELSYLSIRSGDIRRELLAGTVDCCFIYGYDEARHTEPNLGYLELIRDVPCCFVPYSHPLAGEKQLSLNDLLPYELLIVERGTDDFHDLLWQEIEASGLPFRLTPIRDGDIGVTIHSGSRPVIAVGSYLQSNIPLHTALIPFCFQGRDIPVGLLFRKEDLAFYHAKILPLLQPVYREILDTLHAAQPV